MKRFFSLLLLGVVNICAFASRDKVPSDAVLAKNYTPGDVCVCIYVPTDMACNDIVLTGSFNNWSTIVTDCATFEAVVGYYGWYVSSFKPDSLPDAANGIMAKPLMLDAFGAFSWDYLVATATYIRGGVQIINDPVLHNIDLNNYSIDVPNVYIVEAWRKNQCANYSWGENLIWDLSDGILTISGTGDMTNYGGLHSPWYHLRDYINSIVITDGVTSIGSNVFYGCANVTSITIPNSITNIGHTAFYGCTSLTSVVIPNSVNNIGWNAFSGCNNLQSPVYNSHVFAYMPISYSGAYTIPDNIELIADGAFSGCTGLSSVTIPHSIKNVGRNAFTGCNNLTDIYVASCDDLDRIKQLLGNDSRVKYKPLPYSISTIAQNGYISTNIDEITICDEPLVTCTVYANYGYHFTQWSDGNTDNPRTIELTQDTTFIAEIAINVYSVSLTCDTARGSVEGLQGEFNHGTELSYKAIPKYGYHFDRWSDNNTENPRIISIIRDINLEALFVPNSYTISVISDSTHGIISGAGIYDYLESCIVQAYPNQGFYFSEWKDGNTENPRTIELTQDTTMEAIFDYQMSDKCGKDYALTWTLDTAKMALNITGNGALSENYTYGTFIEKLTIGNEVTSIGRLAFYGCNNLKKVILGSSVKVLEDYAFYNCTSIETITCYSQRPPTVNEGALKGLDYSTIVYVPADYLETYKMHDIWGLYDVRPLETPETIEWIEGKNINPINKLLRNGQILILRGNHTYTLNGQGVK